MTYTEDIIRWQVKRIEALEEKVEELTIKIQILENNAKQDYTH